MMVLLLNMMIMMILHVMNLMVLLWGIWWSCVIRGIWWSYIYEDYKHSPTVWWRTLYCHHMHHFLHGCMFWWQIWWIIWARCCINDESDAGSGDSPVQWWWIWAMLNRSGEELIAKFWTWGPARWVGSKRKRDLLVNFLVSNPLKMQMQCIIFDGRCWWIFDDLLTWRDKCCR